MIKLFHKAQCYIILPEAKTLILLLFDLGNIFLGSRYKLWRCILVWISTSAQWTTHIIDLHSGCSDSNHHKS